MEYNEEPDNFEDYEFPEPQYFQQEEQANQIVSNFIRESSVRLPSEILTYISTFLNQQEKIQLNEQIGGFYIFDEKLTSQQIISNNLYEQGLKHVDLTMPIAFNAIYTEILEIYNSNLIFNNHNFIRLREIIIRDSDDYFGEIFVLQVPKTVFKLTFINCQNYFLIDNLKQLVFSKNRVFQYIDGNSLPKGLEALTFDNTCIVKNLENTNLKYIEVHNLGIKMKFPVSLESLVLNHLLISLDLKYLINLKYFSAHSEISNIRVYIPNTVEDSFVDENVLATLVSLV